MILEKGIYEISKDLRLSKHDNYKKKFCLFFDNLIPNFQNIALPKGDYKIEKGKIKVLKNYDDSFTMNDIIKDLFTGFRVVYGKNKRKCSLLITGKKRILMFDKRFLKSINEIQRKFVLFHELGHNFVKYNEYKADIFAMNVLLSLGFDPKMIIWQVKRTLKDTDFNNKRISNLQTEFL